MTICFPCRTLEAITVCQKGMKRAIISFRDSASGKSFKHLVGLICTEVRYLRSTPRPGSAPDAAKRPSLGKRDHERFEEHLDGCDDILKGLWCV